MQVTSAKTQTQATRQEPIRKSVTNSEHFKYIFWGEHYGRCFGVTILFHPRRKHVTEKEESLKAIIHVRQEWAATSGLSGTLRAENVLPEAGEILSLEHLTANSVEKA
jgi:hypothetical protein